jgi:UDP-N-acetyl-D-galactosamine dehydrogenase
MLLKQDKNPKAAKVLVMGVTFKENVSDIRNSKVADMVYALKEFSLAVDVVDPHANSEEVQHEYGFDLTEAIGTAYDVIIAAVSHEEYKTLDINYFKSISTKSPIFVDLKSMYRHWTAEEVGDLVKWSL